MRRNKHQAVAMAAVLATAFLGAASAAPTATSAPTASSALGVELGFLSVPLATPDPYSFASSVGLWYERSLGRDSPWVAGIWLALAGFHSLDSDFGDSLMYYGGLELGYRLELFDFEDSAAAIRPLLRLGWYARDIEFLGRTDWGSRPILSAGCLVELRWRALDLGWLALLSAPMDNRPVLLVGVLQRVGLCF
ncbi:MAG TPA: hypothetical protein VMV90_08730 [Rectinemataceae bacterium]|nr:hypothetical protein [Rectinemataceae bacterium]